MNYVDFTTAPPSVGIWSRQILQNQDGNSIMAKLEASRWESASGWLHAALHFCYTVCGAGMYCMWGRGCAGVGYSRSEFLMCGLECKHFIQRLVSLPVLLSCYFRNKLNFILQHPSHLYQPHARIDFNLYPRYIQTVPPLLGRPSDASLSSSPPLSLCTLFQQAPRCPKINS